MIEKLMEITKKAERISSSHKIAMLEFEAACESEDSVKQEETRVKLHQLMDDQLDAQVEIFKLKADQLSAFLTKLSKKGL